MITIGAVGLNGIANEAAMQRMSTIIGVGDVACSFRWYLRLLCREGAAAPEHFGQILDYAGTVLLYLHLWGSHDHPTLMVRSACDIGNGLILFLRTDRFELSLTTAHTLVEHWEQEPRRNPNTGTMEFAVRDPDGYHVMVSST